MSRWCLAALLALATATASADELRPFTGDSLPAIKQQFAGRPFILTLWSLTCHHCVKELQTLGRLARSERGLPLVIVSTDTPAEAREIQAALKRFGLGRFDTWVFDDAVPERLRHAIDPGWRGELPRSYLFDAAHRREAHSGLLGEARLKDWLKRQRAGE
ncbi:MAG: TlpA family protein disulfide reductase [Planctomycetes bacterium]|nr:TlpA family protein disulfide reductase [Planctomycetota bacterium]